jgi:RNA polymerase sigma-70 factor (ECF subfamily)
LKFGFELDEAKEVVHSAFVKLWESRHRLSCDIPVKAYLYKIIANISVDIFRHDKVRHKHEEYVLQNVSDSGSQTTFNNPDVKELIADIDKAVAELPEQMRRVFELSRYQGLKYAEISSHLNISVKTVETQMSRALIKLREKLSHHISVFCILFILTF